MNTATRSTTTPSEPTTTEVATAEVATAEKHRIVELSATQLIGGALAAATAATLGSRLGLAGTISGAVVVSLLTGVAAAVYTSSLRHGRDRVRAAVTGTKLESLPTRARKGVLGSAVVLIIALAAITGYELITGHALSGGRGTTVSQLGGGHGGPAHRSPAPSNPVPSSPSDSVPNSPSAPSSPTSGSGPSAATPSTDPSSAPSTGTASSPSAIPSSGAGSTTPGAGQAP